MIILELNVNLRLGEKYFLDLILCTFPCRSIFIQIKTIRIVKSGNKRKDFMVTVKLSETNTCIKESRFMKTV